MSLNFLELQVSVKVWHFLLLCTACAACLECLGAQIIFQAHSDTWASHAQGSHQKLVWMTELVFISVFGICRAVDASLESAT